jgi:pSer/pThr/pTyr-binding forkhead associated (FHA) protein
MAYLRIYAGDVLSDQLQLTGDRITIGRAADNHIVLKAPGVSGHHAVIEREGSVYVLSDNQSTNGIFVNGRRIERHSLNYWDEIQIYNFVLKFMALAKLPGEQEGRLVGGPRDRQDETMEVDVSGIPDLLNLRRHQNSAYLVDGAGRHFLDKVNFTIGRARRCDIRLGGWLTPGTAATIQRRPNGYYLVPSRRGGVLVNGRGVARTVRLEDDFEISVRGVRLRYYCRPVSRA